MAVNVTLHLPRRAIARTRTFTFQGYLTSTSRSDSPHPTKCLSYPLATVLSTESRATQLLLLSKWRQTNLKVWPLMQPVSCALVKVPSDAPNVPTLDTAPKVSKLVAQRLYR